MEGRVYIKSAGINDMHRLLTHWNVALQMTDANNEIVSYMKSTSGRGNF